MFDNILERKKTFLDSKITKISQQNLFDQKFEIFHVFIFAKINNQNVFDVTLESQKTFLHYKKRKVKKVEKSGFFQRG